MEKRTYTKQEFVNCAVREAVKEELEEFEMCFMYLSP